MAQFDTQRVIAAYQAGQQLKRQKEQQGQEAEDRKFEIEKRKIELKALQLGEKERARKEAIEQAGLMQGQPSQEITAAAPQATPMAFPGQLGEGPTMSGGTQQVEVPLQPVTIPGVMGPDVQIQPQSMQELLRQQRSKQMFESQQKQLEPFTLAEGAARVTPSATGEPSIIQNPKPEPIAPRPTEGEISRGLSGAFYKDKHKLPQTTKLTDVQQAKADVEYETFRKSQTKPEPDETLAALRDIQLQILRQQMKDGKLSPAEFSQAQRLHDDFMKNSKDFITRRDSFENIQSAANSPSAAGDLSLIFAYMRLLDPGSTVREGEFANAQNTAGVPDQIRNLYNRAISGQRLNPTQRQDFVKQAKSVYDNALKNHKRLESFYRGSAKAQGLPEASVVLDLTTSPSGAEQAAVPSDALINANMKANPGMTREQVIAELSK